MKGLILSILFLNLSFGGLAQVHGLFVNDNADLLNYEKRTAKPDIDFHSAFRSYELWGERDSMNTVLPQVLQRAIHPLLDLEIFGSYTDSLDIHSRSIAGIGIEKDLGKKWSLDLAVLGGIIDKPLFEEPYTRQGEVVEGYGRGDGNRNTMTFWDVNGRIGFQADEHFHFELGKGKHFLGDGYRSLFLSDNAAPYPYLRIDTKVWHIRYMNLFSWQQGMFTPGMGSEAFEDKFTSTHMLSWNISEALNIQLFETIIWQGKDSLSNRGFDVQYLNPMIFYRPVEFASGSADNAILGLGFSYRSWPSFHWYGQLALDEFLLREFTNKTGWWGNKFGLQLGVKGHPVPRLGKKLFIQAEYNMVRPFTYSHGSPIQSYSHLNESLVHPLGSNFREMAFISSYRWNQWELRAHFIFSKKGYDESGQNLGGDIFRSYADPFSTFGNEIGQGRLIESYRTDIYTSYILDKDRDTRIQLGYSLDFIGGEIPDQIIHGLRVGIRSSLGDGYR